MYQFRNKKRARSATFVVLNFFTRFMRFSGHQLYAYCFNNFSRCFTIENGVVNTVRTFLPLAYDSNAANDDFGHTAVNHSCWRFDTRIAPFYETNFFKLVLFYMFWY